MDNGNPFYHALLDFAVDQPIDIPTAGTLSDTTVFDGAAAGYPDITANNIQIILAVFDDEPHQSYSDPPSGNPFWAYYSDECIAVTLEGINNPPSDPDIDGPDSGDAGTEYDYDFTSIDPDGDDVSYYIKWGDGHITPWTDFQASNTPYSESHAWNSQGTFTIEAKAKDSNGAESGWSTLVVTMPRNRAINTPFLRFLQQFPNAFPILRQLLGL